MDDRSDTETVIELGQRQFGADDQQRFARMTGDVNPMHVDPVVARRLLTGSPLVHGVHTMLAALECLPADMSLAGRAIDCDFVNPVSVGDPVRFSMRTGAMGPDLRATVRGLDCTRIGLHAGACAPGTGPVQRSPGGEAMSFDDLPTPTDRPPESWAGQQQRLRLPAASFADLFPRSSAAWGERRIAALGLLSYFVGMVCPGLHSVFSSLSVAAGDPCDWLRFSVLKYEPRFRIVVVAFDGCLRGTLKAFVRPRSQVQPGSAELLPLLRPDEFGARQAWVIGGSRGLGELTAKLAAAGGARVTLTYAAGADDAERVAGEIGRSGRGASVAQALDVVADDLAAWVARMPAPDAVFYFATPRIFRKKAGTFDAAVFDEFLSFYVHRFEALCAALERRGCPVRIFMPSTTAIDERPRGMTEYVMAKVAAEVLCADLERALEHVRLVWRRLPRLATDQTASLVSARHESNVDTLLPIVRELLSPWEAG